MPVALSGWWIFGWVTAGVVVLIAAALLLAIIGLGRQIVRQAGEITGALDGARENTLGLWEVKKTNMTIDRITRGLAAARVALTSDRSP
jgi:hypothetical protein